MVTREEIEAAKNVLRSAGFSVDNLWSVHDVTDTFNCNHKDAAAVLDAALSNDATSEQVWSAIRMIGDGAGLERIDEI